MCRFDGLRGYPADELNNQIDLLAVIINCWKKNPEKSRRYVLMV